MASLEYLQETPKNTDISGIFVFSFYVPGDTLDLENNIYIKGISLYTEIIQRQNSVFHNWKILLYTDEPSYALIKDFFSGKPVDFCIVKWPYFTNEKGKIHGGVMRVMRFRSFFDFKIPIFIRDADTLFTEKIQGKRQIIIDTENLYLWEEDFRKGALKLANTWIFGTSLLYYLPHHKNEEKSLYSPLGAFAGFQSLIPTVPCFQSEEAWNKALQYITQDTIRSEKNGKVSFSNDDNFYKHTGKDERILSFVFLKDCDYKDIFFFELDMSTFRKKDLKGKTYWETDYSSFIFERGSNTKILKVFEDAKKNGFAVNRGEEIKQMRIAIEQDLMNFNSKRKTNIDQYLSGFQDKGIDFLEPRYRGTIMRFFYSEIKKVYEYLETVANEEQKKQLTDAYNDFLVKNEAYEKAQTEIFNKLAYRDKAELNSSESQPYKQIILEKDEAAKKFRDLALTIQSKEDILSGISFLSQPDVARFLNFVPPLEKPKAPPKPNFLNTFKSLPRTTKSSGFKPPSKKGGGKHTRKHKQKRRQTRKRV